jgi:hypothetical protein
MCTDTPVSRWLALSAGADRSRLPEKQRYEFACEKNRGTSSHAGLLKMVLVRLLLLAFPLRSVSSCAVGLALLTCKKKGSQPVAVLLS